MSDTWAVPHHGLLRIDSGPQERRPPALHLLQGVAGQLQETIVLKDVPEGKQAIIQTSLQDLPTFIKG